LGETVAVSHVEYAWEDLSLSHFLRRRAAVLPTLEQRMDDVRAVRAGLSYRHTGPRDRTVPRARGRRFGPIAHRGPGDGLLAPRPPLILRDMTPTTAAITPSKLMGAEVKRKEDPRLITGSSTYVTDIVLPGMLHLAFVRSPHAHATFTKIDARAALKIPA